MDCLSLPALEHLLLDRKKKKKKTLQVIRCVQIVSAHHVPFVTFGLYVSAICISINM